jgi:hypothetical protein
MMPSARPWKEQRDLEAALTSSGVESHHWTMTTSQRKVTQVRSVRVEREANELLGQGWDLFAVAPNSEHQIERGNKPYDYILVKRG